MTVLLHLTAQGLFWFLTSSNPGFLGDSGSPHRTRLEILPARGAARGPSFLDPFSPICKHHHLLNKDGRALSYISICDILVANKAAKDGLVYSVLFSHVHTSSEAWSPPHQPSCLSLLSLINRKWFLKFSTGQEHGKGLVLSLTQQLDPSKHLLRWQLYL